ncbi:MAG: transposase [Longimicrobiales bacterium]
MTWASSDDWHLVSWAGLCPGQDESAGKQRSTRTREAQLLKSNSRASRRDRGPNSLAGQLGANSGTGPPRVVLPARTWPAESAYFHKRAGC